MIALAILATLFAPPSQAALDAAYDYSLARGGHTMVVMVDGKVIYEKYAGKQYETRPQLLASGSKSFVGLAAVAAVQDGYLKLDDRACEALTEWKSDPVKSKITYRQLLNMTSGLEPGDSGVTGKVPGWDDTIKLPVTGTPGKQFVYGGSHLNSFAYALERKLKNETFESYLQRRVLDPLGVKVVWRSRCLDGHPQVAGGATMTARDWATFGEFLRLDCKWNGKQVIKPELFHECLKGSEPNPAYGLTLWLLKQVPKEKAAKIPLVRRTMSPITAAPWLPEGIFMAAGLGEQRLYIIPSLHMVVARQGTLITRGFKDDQFLGKLLGH